MTVPSKLQDQIDRVLEQDVRPVLHLHGGDMEVIDYQDGILRFRFAGCCAGCPSAVLTAEQIVRSALMEAVPEIRDVVLVNEVSPDLLQKAKAILNGTQL